MHRKVGVEFSPPSFHRKNVITIVVFSEIEKAALRTSENQIEKSENAPGIIFNICPTIIVKRSNNCQI